jgi:hypothetical protein
VESRAAECYEPSCHWQNAESLLQHADADVLTIMDCCYSTASMNKALRHVTRSYETIAASHALTRGPGPSSLTRALIIALKELRDDIAKTEQRSFDTLRLHGHIDDIMRRAYANHKLPRLYNRNESCNARHICLAPITSSVVPKTHRADRATGVLHLQVVFSKNRELSRDETLLLGSSLASAARKANPSITALDWVMFDPHPLDVRTTLQATVYLKAWVRKWRSKQRKLACGRTRDFARKRDHDEGDEVNPLKRQRLTW